MEAGERVSVFCHTETERFEVSVVRQGLEVTEVYRKAGLAGKEQVLGTELSVTGCDWKPALEIGVDPSWPSGFYLVRLRAAEGETAEAFFVVRSQQRHDAMLVLSTSTWAAYNNWGGPSFYTMSYEGGVMPSDVMPGGHVSATQRPLPKGFLARPEPQRYRAAGVQDLAAGELEAFEQAGHSLWSFAAGWAGWEHLFVRWAEREGLTLDYAVSHDLDRDQDLLSGYSLYLSVGHDEYWSGGMRDTVEGYVDSGGNAAFFSGNTSFWQVRFERGYEQVVGYKLAFEDDPVYGTERGQSLSTMWSDPLVARPENHMTGVSFTRGGYAHMRNAPHGSGGYTVWRPADWTFEGLGLFCGDLLGSDPVVVGYECDGCDLTLRDGLPVATGRDGTPEDFVVLATAPAHLWETHEGAAAGLPDGYVGELNWVAKRLGGADTPENREKYASGRAVMGRFRRGRGEVFTTGCTDWVHGLGDPVVAQVTRNVLDRFLKTR